MIFYNDSIWHATFLLLSPETCFFQNNTYLHGTICMLSLLVFKLDQKVVWMLLEDWQECKVSRSASLVSLPCEGFFSFLLCRRYSPIVILLVDCDLFDAVCHFFFMHCDQLEEARQAVWIPRSWSISSEFQQAWLKKSILRKSLCTTEMITWN